MPGAVSVAIAAPFTNQALVDKQCRTPTVVPVPVLHITAGRQGRTRILGMPGIRVGMARFRRRERGRQLGTKAAGETAIARSGSAGFSFRIPDSVGRLTTALLGGRQNGRTRGRRLCATRFGGRAFRKEHGAVPDFAGQKRAAVLSKFGQGPVHTAVEVTAALGPPFVEDVLIGVLGKS